MSGDLCGLFAEIWKSRPEEVDVRKFLEQHLDTTPVQWLEVILYDQNQRWKCGKPRSVEHYLNEFPELKRHTESTLKLIVGELQSCFAHGRENSVADLMARLPELNDEIHRELTRAEQATNRSQPHVEFGSFYSGEVQHEYRTIGRYRLLELLGEGGFGQVWLAWDPVLERKVAIKLARPDRSLEPQDAEAFLREARLLAALSHPNIVGVHDIGRSDGRICIVFDFIDGMDLGKVLKARTLTFHEAADLIATVACALHYAHTRGLIHRDLKPSNLLIEKATQKPFIADFGMAVRENDYSEVGRFSGTPGYVSPEQIRGESHRVDARCDIFALGVVFHELLTGTKAFPGNHAREVLECVVHKEPTAPRKVNPQIPPELERICLKAMSKRASDRYSTAQDMASELQSWMTQVSVLPPEHQPAMMVPKGLRSFDASDTHFYLSLLPGPRNRDGLPECIAFWKERIEETAGERSFSVGLIYGPSGCGKSSLVKAGLMPCLSSHIRSVYVEATADDTEAGILKMLRTRMPELAQNESLTETLGSIRRGNSSRVVLVIDQFEQWLHAHRTETEPELVTALRQCDGIRLQAIVMVRDDFWLAVSRFMNQLEVPLHQGVNTHLVDLFDTDHAVKVLTRIGQAYGKIPTSDAEISDNQRAFLVKAVEGLAEDGRVVCVRLTILGEMVKGKAWRQETLADMGGTEGIGVAFLDEIFSSRFANPRHRQYQQAARAVLTSLLPEPGTDIKGHMRSHHALQIAAGLNDREAEFEEVLHILDGELRLITPTDPEGNDSRDSRMTLPHSTRYYQLTHDYLVPSLREWLTRKLRETRKGQAELKLDECVRTWSIRRENKQLPTLREWLTIRILTDSESWTDLQRAMMAKATSVHATFWGGVLLLVAAVSFGVFRQHESNLLQQVHTTVEALQNTSGPMVTVNLERLSAFPSRIVLPELRSRFIAVNDDDQKLLLAFGLARYGELDAQYLISRIEDLTEVNTRNFVEALKTDRGSGISALANEISTCQAPKLWRRKAKLSLVALALGEGQFAQEMCTFENTPDPEQRTLFIDEFPHWDLELDGILETVKSSDSAAMRSGVCLGVGLIPVSRIRDRDRAAWTQVASKWYVEQVDSTTHSASAWLLKRWNQKLPVISNSNEDSLSRDWYSIRTNGITMVRIRSTIQMGSDSDSDPPSVLYPDDAESGKAAEKNSSGPAIDHEFWISDREVTRRQFEQFVNDVDCPVEARITDWGGVSEEVSPGPDHPVQQVNWYDAVRYCNWLSWREQLAPCYVKPEVTEVENDPDTVVLWRLVPEADGYRLPEEKEWEFACRAGTRTRFSSGDDEFLLRGYCQLYPATQTAICGQKLPNSLGLHDFHGNVIEWCSDLYDGTGNRIAIRGGSYDARAETSSSDYRNSEEPGCRAHLYGFRICRRMPL